MPGRARALTLMEALIFGSMLVLIGSLAIPQIQGARIATNELEAVTVLRSLRDAYRLAAREGGAPPAMEALLETLRGTFPDATLLPAPGDGGPPLLAHHGYLFALYPRLSVDEESQPTPDCLGIYAWPREIDTSGTAVFFLDGRGRGFFSRNLVQRYSGVRVRPEPLAALPRNLPVASGLGDPGQGHQGKDDQRWDPLPHSAS